MTELKVNSLPPLSEDAERDSPPSPSSVPPSPSARVRASFQLGWKLDTLIGLFQLKPPADRHKEVQLPPRDVPERPYPRIKTLLLDIDHLTQLTYGSDPLTAQDSPGGLPHDLQDLLAQIRREADETAQVSMGVILKLNDRIGSSLDTLETDSAFLDAYELGKALSRTYWAVRLCGYHYQDSGEVVSVVATESLDDLKVWDSMFDEARVIEIEQRLRRLGSALGEDRVKAVAADLQYWRYALTHLPVSRSRLLRVAFGLSSKVKANSSSSHPISETLYHRRDLARPLLESLREQSENWYDLLTGRQSLETFGAGGITPVVLVREAGGLKNDTLPAGPRHAVIFPAQEGEPAVTNGTTHGTTPSAISVVNRLLSDSNGLLSVLVSIVLAAMLPIVLVILAWVLGQPLWEMCALVFSAGAAGGLVNALLSDNAFSFPRKSDDGSVYLPGCLVNVFVGGVAAVVTWGLYGPLAQAAIRPTGSPGVHAPLILATPSSLVLPLSALMSALLVGVGGARWLTNEVDKKVLSAAATKAAASRPDQGAALRMQHASPAEALEIADRLPAAG